MAGPCSPRPRLVVIAIVVATVVSAAIATDVSRPSRAAGTRTGPGPSGPVVYRPPVDAPVLDGFRAPAHRYAAGNRGIDYAVAPGTEARAMADGEVIFAGPVAGARHVTVRHADGLRSSYSFLATVAVHPGQHVRLGDVVGRTGEILHVGVRTPDGTYVDPATLFGPPRQARLVPGGDDGSVDERSRARERADLAAVVAERAGPLGALLAGGRELVPDLLARARLWQHLIAEANWSTHAQRIGTGLSRWALERDACTPADRPAPAPGAGRILVEVAGIGSTSEAAAVADVDARTLGYAPGAVVRFSYAGGRVPPPVDADPGPLDEGAVLAGVPVTSYGAAQSQVPLAESADRLAELLRAVAAARPGTPIDVVAHSQGGVVARLGITRAAAAGALPGEVAHLVTLGTPHHGADAAGAALVARSSRSGRVAVGVGEDLLGLELESGSPAVRDLAPGSTVMAELDARPPPGSVRFTSIAARGDLVVPAPRSAADGARVVTVPLAGPAAHDRLPGAPETGRELALALADQDPGCRGLTEVTADLLVGEQIAHVEATGALLVGSVAVMAGPP